jgi:hypothetical protein
MKPEQLLSPRFYSLECDGLAREATNFQDLFDSGIGGQSKHLRGINENKMEC